MALNQNPGYRPGENHAKCDYCDRDFYASELQKDWQGFYACPKDFTLRNPQDFIRPKPEKIIPTVIRPDDTIGENDVTTMVAAVPSSVTASLDDLHWNFQTGTAGVYALAFPSANDAVYRSTYSVLLVIELVDSLTSSLQSITSIVPATGTLVGSQTIRPGTMAAFRNYPLSNTWIRER